MRLRFEGIEETKLGIVTSTFKGMHVKWGKKLDEEGRTAMSGLDLYSHTLS